MHLLCTTSISAKNTNKNRATELLLFCIKVDKRRKKGKDTPDGDGFTEVFYLCSMYQSINFTCGHAVMMLLA